MQFRHGTVGCWKHAIFEPDTYLGDGGPDGLWSDPKLFGA